MAGDDEKPWTVSRCNRLLRPLSSKLAKLRKELELPQTANREPRTTSSAFATKSTPKKTTNFTRPAKKPRGFEKAGDPDWRPDAKGAKRTYGGRKAKKLAESKASSAVAETAARPGEIAFTPLVKRMSGQVLDSPLTQELWADKHADNRAAVLMAMQQTGGSLHIPENVRRLLLGMQQAYANILFHTREKKSAKGTGSLLDACLKKLPAYIELEEHFAKFDQLEEETEVEDRDVANEIYEELESRFEQKPGQGWRPFKQVVRAHATSLLCSAITDGILTMESLSSFHTQCLTIGAHEEAEEMLVAALSLLEPLSIPINVRADLFGDRSMYLSMVRIFVDRTSRYRFLYDVLEHMVAHELLPLEWLATTSMRPVWDRLVRTITEGNQRTLASCSRFLETCILAGIGLPDERLLADEDSGSIARRFVPSSRDDLREALNTTYSSLITMLCSIALVNSGRQDTAGKTIQRRVVGALDSIAIALISHSGIDTELRFLGADSDDLQIFAQRALWAIFAPFLVRLENNTPAKDSIELSTSGLVRSLNNVMYEYASNGVNSSTVLATLQTLVSATARGTGRIQQNDGFDQLQRLVEAMTGLSGHRLPHKLWTLKRVALESATEFANSTDEAEHLRWVDEVEKQMRISGRLVIMPTPRKTDTPSGVAGSGFRWEDGIGEWVACTPFAKQPNARTAQEPVRPLELMPTPVHSEDEDGVAFVQDSCHHVNNEPVLPSSPMLHSSPIKCAFRPSTKALGKRQRASSPCVMIPVKRMQMTPPDTPVPFYPLLPEESLDDKPEERGRQLRRSTMEIKTLRHSLKSQRSRSILDSGLRLLSRVSYIFGTDGANDEFDDNTDNDSEDELSFGF